jgi:hypothetical protein
MLVLAPGTRVRKRLKRRRRDFGFLSGVESSHGDSIQVAHSKFIWDADLAGASE